MTDHSRDSANPSGLEADDDAGPVRPARRGLILATLGGILVGLWLVTILVLAARL